MTRRSRLILTAAIGLAILATDAFVGRGQSTPSEHQQAEHQRGTGDLNKALREGVVTPPAADLHAHDKERQAKKDAEDSAALEAYESTACATWWLVLATLGLIGVGFYVGREQMRLMVGQADLTREGLGLQRANVNLERPWVLAKLTEINVGDAVRKNETTMSVEVSLVNYGRSPGWVVESVCRFELIEGPLPEEPPYGQIHEGDILPIPPGQPVVLARSARSLTPDMRAGFMNWWDTRRSLVVFGVVRYRDGISDTVHETRFCWTWYNREYPNGPRAWRGAS